MIINGGKIMELQDIISEAKENDEAIIILTEKVVNGVNDIWIRPHYFY